MGSGINRSLLLWRKLGITHFYPPVIDLVSAFLPRRAQSVKYRDSVFDPALGQSDRYLDSRCIAGRLVYPVDKVLVPYRH